MLGKTLLKTARKHKISKTAQHLMDLELKYGCRNDAPIPVVLARGQGIHVWDVDGKQYIDCLAGYSAVNQGHCHPKIQEAMIKQCQTITLTSRAFHNNLLGLWTQRVCETFDFDKVLFSSGGVEASEAAVKFARRWGYDVKGIQNDQARVLFANKNFWGRSLAACGSSDDPGRYARFGPFKGLNFDLIDFNDPHALEIALKNEPNYVAFMIEPIQGEAGVIVPKHGYLKKCREICDKYNVLLIFDEIQTGIGRTGKLLAGEWEGVKPDILSLGKSLSGGFYPVSATLTNAEVMDCIKPGEHGSTYGGNPMACAVGQAALDVVFEEGLVENSLIQGEYFRQELRKIKKDKDFIVDVRGRGLMNAMEIHPEYEFTAREICIMLMEEGLLAKQTHDKNIRMTPPLISTREDIDRMLEKVNTVMDRLP